MDYTNFVRTYYRIAMNKLSEIRQYNGSIVDFNFELDIPEDKKHEVDRNSLFLPNYDININAETEYFVKFLDYYGTIISDLGEILLDEDGLKHLYTQYMQRYGDDDEKIVNCMNIYVDVVITMKKELGILR